MKYFKVCGSCGKDYDIEADPQDEQEYKTIQDQIGKKGGLCEPCASITIPDDGCMELKSPPMTGQYLRQAEMADLYNRTTAVSLIKIAEKYNAVITAPIQGQEGMEILCDPKDAEAIEREILSYKRQLSKVRVYTSM